MIPDESTFVFWMTKKKHHPPFFFFFSFFFLFDDLLLLLFFHAMKKQVQIRSAKKEDLEKDFDDKMSSTNERTNEQNL